MSIWTRPPATHLPLMLTMRTRTLHYFKRRFFFHSFSFAYLCWYVSLSIPLIAFHWSIFLLPSRLHLRPHCQKANFHYIITLNENYGILMWKQRWRMRQETQQTSQNTESNESLLTISCVSLMNTAFSMPAWLIIKITPTIHVSSKLNDTDMLRSHSIRHTNAMTYKNSSGYNGRRSVYVWPSRLYK